MKTYIVNIFKTYQSWFILVAALNAAISLNFISYAMLGVTITTIDSERGFAQICIWVISSFVLCVAIGEDVHKK